MRCNTPVETHGRLERVAVEDGFLTAAGWVAPVDGSPVDDFKVHCAGKLLPHGQVTTNLPSPGVKVYHPGLEDAENGRFEIPGVLPNADHCGFQIRIPLNDRLLSEARASYIGLVPLLEQLEGGVMVRILTPALPLPHKEEGDLIGSSYTFLQVACDFLGFFIQRAGLDPNDAVLDVGCGVGRMAHSLVHYLAPNASYEGFDIADRLVDWCQREVSPRFPNFGFRKVDLYNKLYNPSGTGSAERFTFPYESERFDFVLLASVFTHMLPQEVRHYLDEIHRVLRPGGRCLCTLFLMNADAEALIRAGKSTQDMCHPLEECYTTLPDLPEAAVGFVESRVLEWLAERGFTLAAKCYGSWCGRLRFTSYQDMLIWQK
jgi:SAM-dependent methyltransferase